VDYAGLVHGPVDEGGFAVDEGAGDGAEVAAVAGDEAVVAHDPEVSGGDDAFGLGTVVAVTERDVGLVEWEVVHVDGSAVDAEGVAGKSDNALDVTLGVVAGIEKDDDVAAVDGLEAIGELVDEEAVLILQAGEHTGAFDAHGLVEEEDDEERDGDGDEDVARPGAPAGGSDDGRRRGPGWGFLGFGFVLRFDHRSQPRWQVGVGRPAQSSVSYRLDEMRGRWSQLGDAEHVPRHSLGG
jgi:hypothetical protein